MNALRIRESSERVEYRFFEAELRVEGERTISGVAMRYGDVATLPWGEKERFEPGAFGSTARGDVILNFQHDRARPLARTGGGGLTITDSPTDLRLEAVMPDTREGDDALELVRKRVMRGFSVEFIPDSIRVEKSDGKADLVIVETAKLRNIGLVDRPAYPASRVNPRSQDAMNEAEIRKLIEDALKARDGDGGKVDVDALVRAVAEGSKTTIDASVREQVAAALKERDDAEAARAEEAEKRKKAEQKAKDDEEMMEKKAEERAELLTMVTPLLPDDFTARGASNHDILVAAVGDEVDGAKDRSEDYLRAKVEGIIERRSGDDGTGGTGGGPTPTPRRQPNADPATPVNLVRFMERRNRKPAGPNAAA